VCGGVRTVAASGQLRLQMVLALTNPVSYPLMAVVVGWVAWLCARERQARPAVPRRAFLRRCSLIGATAVYLSRFV
jgi:hypothetical protein